jgi:hypothetical protein
VCVCLAPILWSHSRIEPQEFEFDIMPFGRLLEWPTTPTLTERKGEHGWGQMWAAASHLRCSETGLTKHRWMPILSIGTILR